MRIITTLACAALVVPAAAQLKVSVKSVNAAGVAIEDAAGVVATDNHAANTTFSTQASKRVYQQSPYASAMSTVSPPYASPFNNLTFNYVSINASAFALKGSALKSLRTTDNSQGKAGTQRFQITLASPTAIQVRMDYRAYGYVYDASTLALKFSDGGSNTRSYAWSTAGYNNDNNSITLTVNGSVTIDVELSGTCTPGSSTGGNTYYDGFSASFYANFLEVGNGSFKTFGRGCAKGKIAGSGTPTKGASYDILLQGDNPNRSCALLIGTSKDYYQFLKLPLDLGYMGATGCDLNVGFQYPWFRTTDAKGDATARVYLSPFQSGTYYVQWLVWDPTNPSQLPTLTEGAEVKF